MELDKALQLAVIAAWDDLMKASQPRSVRVEYQGKPGTSLDNVSVWSDQFTRPADAGRNGLVLIDPPGADERQEAATWMNQQVRGSHTKFANAAG